MLFHEYRIESRAQNQILFEANASLLLQALNSGRTSPTCQMKLAKRAGQPCLSIEARVRAREKGGERERRGGKEGRGREGVQRHEGIEDGLGHDEMTVFELEQHAVPAPATSF